MTRIRLDSRLGLLLVGLGIAFTAIVLRTYAIDRLPPGLFGDEAVEGLDALDVLAGNLAIWFPAHFGREPIYVYLVALSYSFFGVSEFATRLPALAAGLATIPATFFFVREWARQVLDESRGLRVAILTTVLLSISFWHLQMTRDAHRDTLLPLVEAIGLFLLWRARRTGKWLAYAGAGLVLGLTIYTYSPGRFVGLMVTIAVGLDLLESLVLGRKPQEFHAADGIPRSERAWSWVGLATAGAMALVVMLPLLMYFGQNPTEFTRRFDSVSVFDTDSPAASLGTSISGNLAQFIVPGAGYQSKHYNLPGKPVFDLFIAPWFVLGFGLAIWRIGRSSFRFLVVWFIIMLVPAFMTADMIPKGVRAFGTVPGVFVFPALAMDALWVKMNSGRKWITSLILLSLIGSTAWTTYDYFVAWANMPELPLAFDSDLTEVSAFVQRQPADRPIYFSTEVYRPPTGMLLGRHVPTSRYVDRATRIKEFDGRSSLMLTENPSAVYVFVRDRHPAEEWLARIANVSTLEEQGKYYAAFKLEEFNLPQHLLNQEVSPYLRLIGYSVYEDEPSGVALYWQVTRVAEGREDFRSTLLLTDERGTIVTQEHHQFPVTPLEWSEGDKYVDWLTLDVQSWAGLKVDLARGKENWTSAWNPRP